MQATQIRVLILVLAVLGAGITPFAAPAAHAADRVAELESRIAQKRHAMQALQRENAEIQASVDAHPADTGVSFSARQQMRSNQRLIDAYRQEIANLEQQLAASREAAAAAAETKPARPAPKAASAGAGASAAPAGDGTPGKHPDSALLAPLAAPVPPLQGSPLDNAQVHELMRTWAHGETGVHGGRSGRLTGPPLALVMSGLDWSLDWRELFAGSLLGVGIGAALPVGIASLLRRSFPVRAPLVGNFNRKWTAVTTVPGSPSKQWVELSEKSATPMRNASIAAALVGAAAAVQAIASWFGLGSGLGTPRPWGEILLLVGAAAMIGAAFAGFHKRSFTVALAAVSATLVIVAIPVTLALTPFGGHGSVAWAFFLAVAAAVQVPAIRYLWQLASPRAAHSAPSRVAGLSAAVGGITGLVAAAFSLLTV